MMTKEKCWNHSSIWFNIWLSNIYRNS